MKQGTMDLVLLGLVFFLLQIWWISSIFKIHGKKGSLATENQLDEIKKRLEKIFIK